MSTQGELKKDYAYRRILEMILNDEVLEDHFPAEPEFCRQLGIARVTLRSAFKRLEKEGYITRSHYYGTRIVRRKSEKRLLIAASDPVFERSNIVALQKKLEIAQLTGLCEERNIFCDTSNLCFLQDPEKIAERYFGVVFFGAALRGNENFLKVIEESGIPAVYIREDENNKITDRFASVGPNIRGAWIAGFEYLAKLGFRRIATLFSHDKRNFQRLGFDRDAFEDFLKQRDFTEAADMICNVTTDQNTPAEQIRSFIEEKNPDAVYCYSDCFAAELYRVLHEMGRKIPQDIAVLSFGMGSDLLTPTLSAVQLSSPLFGQTVLSLLEYLQDNPGKVPFIELPYHILENDSTAIVRLEGMMNENFKVENNI